MPAHDDSAAAPLEKEEMVSEVLRLKEAAARESSEGSAYQLATAAHAEAVAMRSRVVEIDELARRSEWHATLEHSTWLCAEYPQHATLRALRVDALLALKRYEEADRVLDEQLLATPDAPELLHARAMLVYIRQGGEAARTWLSDEVPDLEEDPIHAKSYDLHSCIGCMLSLSEKARKALTMADDVNASILACEALSVAEESPPHGILSGYSSHAASQRAQDMWRRSRHAIKGSPPLPRLEPPYAAAARRRRQPLPRSQPTRSGCFCAAPPPS